MDVIDNLSAQEVLIDGVSEIKIIEGVTRIALYVRQDGESVVAVRLAIPVSELPELIQHLVISLAEAAKQIVKPAIGH